MRVVSMPSWEPFDEQDQAYRDFEQHVKLLALTLELRLSLTPGGR